MIQLASRDTCSGCGVCAAVCPKHCIRMQPDNFGVLYPNIEDSYCVECRKCQKVCPVLNPLAGKIPMKVYAARSNDNNTATNSASGGIAAEMYKYALASGWTIVGAEQNKDFSVSLALSRDKTAIKRFQNSKYVFSEAHKIFDKIKISLKGNDKILIIALPCQIAAIKNVFPDNNDKLYFVDIVCHGTTPASYLKQHIRKIESKLNKKTVKMSFRAPEFGTGTFTFSLYNNDGLCFYFKRTKDGDTYQYGYHRHLSYRENCYNCKYACPERQGDITLADYPGLGKSSQFPYKKDNISCVLINTDRGFHLIQQLILENKIWAIERPVEEAIVGNGQLRRPTPRPYLRNIFLKRMKSTNYNFEKAISPLVHLGLFSEKLNKVTKLPLRVLNKIRRTFIR